MRKLTPRVKNCITAALLLLLAILFVWTCLHHQKYGFREIAVEDGQTTFTATMPRILSLAVCNEDASLGTAPDETRTILTITISDAAGNMVALLSNQDADTPGMAIHTNGFTSRDNCNLSGFPVDLSEGSEYTLTYEAEGLTHLSFLLYGDLYYLKWLELLIILSAAVLIGLVLWGTPSGDETKVEKNHRLRFIPRLLCIVVLWIPVMLQMPLLQSDQETTAFADVYQASSVLLGRDTSAVAAIDSTAEANAVIIEESGIRNLGYLSYCVPFERFWRDFSYGNDRSNPAPSLIFQGSGRNVSLWMLPSVAAVAAARAANLPYQLVLMSGWCMNALLMMLMLLILHRILREREVLFNPVLSVILLPSMLVAGLSYTAFGLAVLGVVAGTVLCVRNEMEKEKSRRTRWLVALGAALVIVSLVYLRLPCSWRGLETLAAGGYFSTEGTVVLAFLCLICVAGTLPGSLDKLPAGWQDRFLKLEVFASFAILIYRFGKL